MEKERHVSRRRPISYPREILLIQEIDSIPKLLHHFSELCLSPLHFLGMEGSMHMYTHIVRIGQTDLIFQT